MTSEEAVVKIKCPTEEELQNYQKQTLKCPVGECGKTFKNASSKRMHMAKTHNYGDKETIEAFNKAFLTLKTKTKFACPVSTCSRKLGSGWYFRGITPLRAHYLSAHAEKIHNCSKCGAKFGSPVVLNQHVKACGRLFTCTCGCPFKTKLSLLNHSIKLHHRLPESINQEFLSRHRKQRDLDQRRKGPLKLLIGDQLESYLQPSSTQPIKVRTSDAVTRPAMVAPHNQSIKANGYLLIFNEKSLDQNTDRASNDIRERPVFKPQLNAATESHVVKSSTADSSVIFDRTESQKALNRQSAMNQIAIEIESDFLKVMESKDAATPRNNAASFKASNTAKSVNVSSPNHIESSNKLTRLKKAMQKYVPILKKTQDPPALREGPRNRYLNQLPAKVVRVNSDLAKLPCNKNTQDDHNSLLSIQNCLHQAAQFVNKTLPKIGSPQRLANDNFTAKNNNEIEALGSPTNENCINVDARKMVNSHKKSSTLQFKSSSSSKHRSKARRNVKQSFVKYASCSEVITPSDVDNSCNNEAHNSKTGSRQQTSDANYHVQRTASLKRTAEDSNGPNLQDKRSCRETRHGSDAQLGQFGIDELSPEFVYFLRNFSETQIMKKTCLFSNETSSQETQTPIKTAELQFASSFNDLSTFDNSDIHTQTEEFSGLLSDAFTQTSHQHKLSSSHQHKSSSSHQHKSSSSHQHKSSSSHQHKSSSSYQHKSSSSHQHKSSSSHQHQSSSSHQHNQLTTGLSPIIAEFQTAQGDDPAADYISHSPPSWLTNNNETQTDSLHDLLSDAFTQTRFSAAENQASQTCLTDGSISDNHTQTNLSFDNFLRNLNFDDQTSLDTSVLPDLADMCTQTNLDPSFKEILGITSAKAQTVNSTATQAESSNSHTQTQLTFDDLFANSFTADDFVADREINNTYTQTIIDDDIFFADNFTQTQT